MMSKKRFWYGLLFIVLALLIASSMLLVACGKNKKETPTPTETPAVTATPLVTPTAAPTTPTNTATAVPITPVPTATTAAPAKPAGWQEMPQDLQDKYQINCYFPGDWSIMTAQPVPTVILTLAPTSLPYVVVREFDITDSTTPGQFRAWIMDKYPSKNGGEYDNFTVLDQGNVTLDDGTNTVTLTYKGTRLGFGTEGYAVFITRGTQGFILSGNDNPVTFSDSLALVTQIVKTFHSIAPLPVYPVETPSPIATATATPTVAPTTVAPAAGTVAPTTPVPTPTAAPTTP